MRKELNKSKTSDAKEYWKLLNRSKEKKKPDIPLEDFFKNLNTVPDSPTREEEHFNQEPLDNVDFDRLNEGTTGRNTFLY